MDIFISLIKDQFTYGGKKYGLTTERESTDDIFDVYGKNWLFGTMAKYIYRFSNLQQEKDLLKIACYCFILWLKKGFFIKKEGLVDVISTNLELKKSYFPKFAEFIKIQEYFTKSLLAESEKNCLESISDTLERWANTEWKDLSEYSIKKVFLLCYKIWGKRFENTIEHNTDTPNGTNIK